MAREVTREGLSYDERRHSRARAVRARTLIPKTMGPLVRRERAEYPAEEIAANQAARPKTRAECPDTWEGGRRVCAWVGCRYNLYLEAHPRTGSLKMLYPDLEPGELPVNCSLDVADAVAASGRPLSELDVAELVNVTAEGLRHLCATVWERLRRAVGAVGGLQALVPEPLEGPPFYGRSRRVSVPLAELPAPARLRLPLYVERKGAA